MFRTISSRIRRAGVAVAIVFATAAQASPTPNRSDLLWLDRITYGVNSSTLAAFEQSGRRGYLQP